MYDNITKLAMFEEYSLIGTREISRYSSGFLLREIIERFYKKIDVENPLKPNRNLWLYSAHDTTITGLMNLLGLLEVSVLGFNFNNLHKNLIIFEWHSRHFHHFRQASF